jgi:hypothetical protein
VMQAHMPLQEWRNSSTPKDSAKSKIDPRKPSPW